MMADSLSRRVIQAYAELDEPWKVSHDLAMLCADLEDAITWGLSLLQTLIAQDNSWQARMLERKSPYDPAKEEEFVDNYRRWLVGSERIMQGVVFMESHGFEVRGADELRQKCAETQRMLQDDEEVFVDDALIKLRDEAIDEHRAGKATPCGGGAA